MKRAPRFPVTNGVRCWRCCPRPHVNETCPCPCHLKIGDRVMCDATGDVGMIVDVYCIEESMASVAIERWAGDLPVFERKTKWIPAADLRRVPESI